MKVSKNTKSTEKCSSAQQHLLQYQQLSLDLYIFNQTLLKINFRTQRIHGREVNSSLIMSWLSFTTPVCSWVDFNTSSISDRYQEGHFSAIRVIPSIICIDPSASRVDPLTPSDKTRRSTYIYSCTKKKLSHLFTIWLSVSTSDKQKNILWNYV